MLRAVLGGSFDPVHLGHLAVVDHMLKMKLADLLVIMPAWRSPHKFENSAGPVDRLAGDGFPSPWKPWRNWPASFPPIICAWS
jgi:cytidyltransferase-like protein